MDGRMVGARIVSSLLYYSKHTGGAMQDDMRAGPATITLGPSEMLAQHRTSTRCDHATAFVLPAGGSGGDSALIPILWVTTASLVLRAAWERRQWIERVIRSSHGCDLYAG